MGGRGIRQWVGARWARSAAAAVVLQSVAACGGGGGSSTGPTGGLPASVTSTTVTVLSGESRLPVQGARVVVAGESHTTDEAGQAALSGLATRLINVDVVADGFLDRNTRMDAGPLFTLWPKSSASGLTEQFSMMVVYTRWPSCLQEPGLLGGRSLWRPRQGQVFALVPSAEILADPQALAAQERAAQEANEAMGDLVSFIVTDSPPAGATRIDLMVDSSVDCQRASAVNRGNEYAYCELRIARRWQTALHEIGHSLGMQHHPTDGWLPGDIMSCYGSWAPGVEAFSARERLAVRLMFQRTVGNSWPDRDTLAASAVDFEPFECG